MHVNCVDYNKALDWHSYGHCTIWCVGVLSLYIGCSEVLQVLGGLVGEQDVGLEWILVGLRTVYGLCGL